MLENIFPFPELSRGGNSPFTIPKETTLNPFIVWGEKEERQEDFEVMVCCHEPICSAFTEQEPLSSANRVL